MMSVKGGVAMLEYFGGSMSTDLHQKENGAGELSGLTTSRAQELLAQAGPNDIGADRKKSIFHIAGDTLKEPMALLLLATCFLYFLLREPGQGFLMMLALGFVTAISVYQERKSSRALAELRKYTEPKVKCMRDGVWAEILSAELVPGDLILIEEGGIIPADAVIVQCNDFSVNESVITGESFPVAKEEGVPVFQGTTVNSGKCYARVTKTGAATVLGGIGRQTVAVVRERTVLQKQVSAFIRWMTVFGVTSFAVVWLFSYIRTSDVAQSLLFGLTLAMSAIPEEIPVAFSSFLALGAWRMARLGIVVREPLTIESLGAVSVICLDKTGTLTENRMKVSACYEFGEGAKLLWYARLACEPEPFDAMEQAIVAEFAQSAVAGLAQSAVGGLAQSVAAADYGRLAFIHEYPLEGRPPMMTHVYLSEGKRIAAAKGGPERIMKVCGLGEADHERVRLKVAEMAARGFRVLGVASASVPEGPFPETQEGFGWQFEGLVALEDPPKANLAPVLASWIRAGIRIKVISGDHPETVVNIAAAAGVPGASDYLTGDQVVAMSDAQLREEAGRINIFTRMFPEAKLRVIEALKASGETVAMTGDGVNDGPAIKAAHIGIAMGARGTEMAKQAADLVISDDDLERITEAIRHGRTIYANLKKAIRYLITIHIPILTTASLPVLLGWRFPTVFAPIHLIFLEIIMGPTCSIFYEREPVEANIMNRPPRVEQRGLLGGREARRAILQGGIAAAGMLGLYSFFMQHGYSLEYTRTAVFDTLVLDNILLTFVNRSFTENLLKTIRRKNPLMLPVLLLSTGFLVLINWVTPVMGIFGLTRLSGTDMLLCAGVSLLSVIWIELFKR